jgi:23S rRNA pseudouridine2605 synthase
MTNLTEQLKELHINNTEKTIKKNVKQRRSRILKTNIKIINVESKVKNTGHFIGNTIRLSKALTLAGFGSRRKCDELISSGFIKVNGKQAILGSKVTNADKILAYDRPVYFKIDNFLPRVILYNKPEKEIVSREKTDSKVTVFSRLPMLKNNKSFIAIGRLDYNTSGLLIFTNYGELANRMMHPKFAIVREYMVRIFGNRLNAEQIKQMKIGIDLDDGVGVFSSIELLNKEDGINHWYKVSVLEGRNRFVRRMFEYFDLKVSRLIRTRFGEIYLPQQLKLGMHYELPLLEVQTLLNKLDIKQD